MPLVGGQPEDRTDEGKARGDRCVGRACAEESDMAKGQVRKTKEARKPKAIKPVGAKTASVTDVFAKATDEATHHAGKKKTAG